MKCPATLEHSLDGYETTIKSSIDVNMYSQISQEQIIISKKEVLSMQKAPRRMKKHYKKGTRLLYHKRGADARIHWSHDSHTLSP